VAARSVFVTGRCGVPMSLLACQLGISTPAVSKSVSRVLTKITHMTRFIQGSSHDARHREIGFCAVETHFPLSPSVHKVSQEQTPFYHSCRSVRSHRFPISFLINHRPRLTKAPLPRINSLLCGNVLYCENMFNFSGISSCPGNSRKFTRVRR